MTPQRRLSEELIFWLKFPAIHVNYKITHDIEIEVFQNERFKIVWKNLKKTMVF